MSGLSDMFQVLDQSLRRSRRKILVTSLSASLAAVLLFVGASWFLLYRHYRDMVREHYVSMLRAVTGVQTRLLSGDSYNEMMASIGEVLESSAGVRSAWFTDRWGRLVFHTDPVFLETHRAKRLPLPFREHIEQVWRFEGGSPLPVITTPGWNTLRFSLPLYAAGKKEHDFVVGVDGKRFIFLPDETALLAAFAGGWVLAATALLFLPVFIMVGRQMRRVQSQTLTLVGTAGGAAAPVRAAEEQPPPPRPAPEPAPEPQPEIEPAEPEPPPGSVPEPAPEPAAQAPEMPVEMTPRDLFLKIREKHFSGATVDLPFLQGAGIVLHPERTDGVYQFYYQVKTDHYFCMFDTPNEDESRYIDLVPETRTTIRGVLKGSGSLKDRLLRCNQYCLDHDLRLNLNILHIDEGEAAVSFASCGEGYALYLKQGSEEVKDLRLQVPRLGEKDQEGFAREYESADLGFSSGDLFAAMPSNASGIRLRGKLLDYAVREALLAGREAGAAEIGEALVQQFHRLKPEELAKLQETGVVFLRFV